MSGVYISRTRLVRDLPGQRGMCNDMDTCRRPSAWIDDHCSWLTCKKTQIPAQKKATGQAINTKRRIQMRAKRTFLAMVVVDSSRMYTQAVKKKMILCGFLIIIGRQSFWRTRAPIPDFFIRVKRYTNCYIRVNVICESRARGAHTRRARGNRKQKKRRATATAPPSPQPPLCCQNPYDPQGITNNDNNTTTMNEASENWEEEDECRVCRGPAEEGYVRPTKGNSASGTIHHSWCQTLLAWMTCWTD